MTFLKGVICIEQDCNATLIANFFDYHFYQPQGIVQSTKMILID